MVVTQFRASGRRILLRTPLKHRKWSTLSSEVADSPAIFSTFQAHRNTCTGCSESRPRPPECKTVQRFLQLPNARYPRLQGPIRPLIIPAQAAGNLTRQLSFMHPVHSVASTGHTGDIQEITREPQMGCAPLQIWIHMQVLIQIQVQMRMQIYAETDTDADTHIGTGADIDTDTETDTDTRYGILDTGCCAMIVFCC